MMIAKWLASLKLAAIIFLGCFLLHPAYATSKGNDVLAKNIPGLVALAESYEQRQAWLQAASTYQEVLRLNPKFRYARRQLVFNLSQAGMPNLAKYYADQYASEFTEGEQYQLAHDDAALTIRFGEAQLDFDNKTSRFNTTDIALAENAEIAARFNDPPKTQFDRLIALVDRARMQDAAQLYRSLVEAKLLIPSYVKFSAATAYLCVEQPEMARDLILDGLKDSTSYDANTLMDEQISLMYAYSEAEQYHEAETLAKEILANQPRAIYKGMPGLEQANSNYLVAYTLNTRLQTTNDRLDMAEENLSVVRAQAPFNNDIRLAWAALQVAREHPRAALGEYSSMLIDHPSSVEAQVGRGGTLLTLNEFTQAKALSATPFLLEVAPGDKAVPNLVRKLEDYGRPFYQIQSTFGQGSVNNGADSFIDARLYSAPLAFNEHVRLFSQLLYANGETLDNNSASRSRLGVGFDYRSRDVDAAIEVDHSLNQPHSNGVILTLGWNISDAWQAGAAIDTNFIDLPAEALAQDISARQAQLNLNWSKNESRKIGGVLSSTRFSDSNVRNIATLTWMERWVSKPIFKFDTLLYLGTSSNSALDRAYFNPSRDRDMSLELTGEWLTWRRYLRSFKQRASVTLGQYWQNGFGSGQAAGIRYEHEWSLENDTLITYGIGRSFQPYDGAREFRKYIYLNLSGRIK